MRRRRLDAELVRRGLARSRGDAAEAVAQGRVRLDGLVATKPSTAVDPAAALVVAPPPVVAAAPHVGAGPPDPPQGPPWASRGAVKLLGAWARLQSDGVAPALVGARCLDAGASTGGFTDALLRRGAASVVAVDVGYGQLAWRLRTDERVHVVERRSVRDLAVDELPDGPVDLVTADLSFISLRLVLPALVRATEPSGHLLVLVKPQFEVGRERVGAGGVVHDDPTRADAVRAVAAAAETLGAGAAGLAPAGLAGPRGNREVFLLLRRGAPPLSEEALAEAVAASPGRTPPPPDPPPPDPPPPDPPQA